ncbi:hypothetical protein MLD38_026423 [Melastoma candidum]|uniref:Uncharacterized protein n=1 Tax=Melastoma candidum TaxID=119954 RepID=A0ACB9P549_9MYRT|nr:hypothetical protein MLD38_026423 [Melastoma candidum]
MGSHGGLEALLPSLVLNEAIIMPQAAGKTTEHWSGSNYPRHSSSHPLRSYHLEGNGRKPARTITTTMQRMHHRQMNERLGGSFGWGHGHGTRVGFVGSCGSRRLCSGTGVFLPKTATTNTQPGNMKPGTTWESRGGGTDGGGKETTKQGCNNLMAPSSPDTFLPKEWTY